MMREQNDRHRLYVCNREIMYFCFKLCIAFSVGSKLGYKFVELHDHRIHNNTFVTKSVIELKLNDNEYHKQHQRLE